MKFYIFLLKIVLIGIYNVDFSVDSFKFLKKLLYFCIYQFLKPLPTYSALGPYNPSLFKV